MDNIIKQFSDDEKNNKGKKEEPNKKPKRVCSAVLEDGRLAEMIYDPIKQKTAFVVGMGDKTEILEKVKVLEEKEEVPLKPSDGMVKVGFIKFPSELGKYETNLTLFNEIKAYIQKYFVLPSNFITIATLYIMMTWVHEKFHVLPYLRVVGMFGTGKTRFLEVIGNVCYKPMMAGGSASTASVFRAVDEIKGTLVFDEADFRNSEAWSEIVKILNSGHTKDFPVMRMEANSDGVFQIKTFYVFGPKILGSRVRFSDEALESRCLTQNLLPINTEIDAPIHLPEDFKKESLEIRNKLLAFRFLNYNNPTLKEQILSGINFPRLKQSILAIVNIAKIVDKSIEKEVLAFALGYEKELQMYQTRAIECDVLICIIELLREIDAIQDPEIIKKTKGKLWVKEIADGYNKRFYDDFNDKEEKTYNMPSSSDWGGGLWTPPNYKVSAKKIGGVISGKLMIKTERDGGGFYIPPSERKKIELLKNRYGITDEMISNNPF